MKIQLETTELKDFLQLNIFLKQELEEEINSAHSWLNDLKKGEFLSKEILVHSVERIRTIRSLLVSFSLDTSIGSAFRLKFEVVDNWHFI